MGNEQVDFELWLKSKFDGSALAAAQSAFEKTKKSTDSAKGSMEELGYSAKRLKESLSEIFAATAIIAQFKEGFEQVAALEQAMNQLERATKRNGDSFDDVKGKIVGMANALKKAAGVDDDAAIKKMSELYNATGDVANAMNLVALATDVAIGAGMDFERANDLVTRAAMGQTRGLKELNISIEEGADKTENADRALAAIRKNFGGAANDAKGLKVELNRLSESYEDIRNNTVEKLMPAIGGAMKAVLSFFAALDSAWGFMADTLVRTITLVGKFGSYLKSVVTGDMDGMKAAVKAMGQEIAGFSEDAAARAKRTAKEIADIWSGQGSKGGVNAGPAKSIVGSGGGAGGGTQKDRDLTAAELELMALSKFQQEMIEKAKKEEERFAEFKKQLKKGGFAYEKKLMSDMDKARDEELDRAIKRTVEEVRMRKKAEEAKEEAAMASASAVIGAMGAVFGESKALATADAVINTWAGAARALKDWPAPYSYVIAAATVAAGLAQVAKIQSTQPSTSGKGFDDPGNDRAAFLGGRRWAADMIGEFTSGVSAGWASGMGGAGGGGSVTYDNRSTMNLHMNVAGFLDPSDTQQMAKFARNLAVVNKTVEGQRRTARTAR